MKLNSLKCKICIKGYLKEFKDFNLLSRVTSDSKPFKHGGRLFVCNKCGGVQKISDEKWLDEIKEIYSKYETFTAEGFYDQLVIDPETSSLKPRCEMLVEKLSETFEKKKIFSWLDYGCGRGAMLQAASKICKDLNGFDLNNKNINYLKNIKNFNNLFTSQEKLKTKKFDMISMIHSLEHFVNPYEDLTFAYDLLDVNGFLFIQVNDTRKNPFEILVADHLTHFEPSTLKNMLEKVGFRVQRVTNNWITKEISLLAVKGQNFRKNKNSKNIPTHDSKKINMQIDWLKSVVIKGKSLSLKKKEFGLFGSSVASTWLAHEIGENVEFFVDEDNHRIGKHHMNRIIKSPQSLTNKNLVYIGLIPEIANRIFKKLKTLECKFELPPSFK